MSRLHDYDRDPHSNAGNCCCGMDYESRVHPHPYTQANRSPLCVCALPANHSIHTDSATARPAPGTPEPTAVTDLRGTDAVREAVRQARGDEAAPQVPVTFASGEPSPAYQRLVAAAHEASEAAHVAAMHSVRDVYRLMLGWLDRTDRRDAAAEVLALLPAPLNEAADAAAPGGEGQ